MVKTTKLVSVCLVTVLLASLFLISGVSGTDTDSNLEYTDNDRISNTGNDTLKPTDPTPSRYVGTTVKKDSITYSGSTGTYTIGKYGAQIVYDGTHGGNNAAFFPTLEVKCDSTTVIETMKITVTGTNPNGQAISGSEIRNMHHLISPQNTGYDWDQGLANVAAAIISLAPYGLGALITNGLEVNGGLLDGYTVSDGRSSTSAWKQYSRNSALGSLDTERGFQMGFDLHCDPDLPGVYILNVHYEITLKTQTGVVGFPVPNMVPVSVDFTQQVTYEFRAPTTKGYAATVVKDTTATAGGANVYNPANMQGNCADDLFGQIYSGGYNCHATAIATIAPNTGITGHIYIYGYSYTTGGKGSHVYVYGSMSDTSGWFVIKEFYTKKDTPYYIDCGNVNTPFKYIAICAFNDDIVSNIYVDSIGVYN